MAVRKSQIKATQKYVKAHYDRIEIKPPKGRRFEIEQAAQRKGLSVNGYICGLIRADLGLTIEQWENPPTESTAQQEPLTESAVQ